MVLLPPCVCNRHFLVSLALLVPLTALLMHHIPHVVKFLSGDFVSDSPGKCTNMHWKIPLALTSAGHVWLTLPLMFVLKVRHALASKRTDRSAEWNYPHLQPSMRWNSISDVFTQSLSSISYRNSDFLDVSYC